MGPSPVPGCEPRGNGRLPEFALQLGVQMHQSWQRNMIRTAFTVTTALALLPGSLPAQQPPAPGNGQDGIHEIIVTGSRIARPDLTAISPIAILDAETIRLSNATTVDELLRRTPQFAPAIGSNTNNGNDGSATIDLRNLGEQRTLVLVNGRRFVPYDYQGVVDVSMIPTSLIERVEVITGGASAVYGADAIAGVVNFILREDFEGIEASATTSRTNHNDGDTHDFSLTAGGNFAGGRGNVVVNLGYTKRDAITQDQRRWSRNALSNLLEFEGSYYTPGSTTLDTGYTGDPLDTCLQFTGTGDISGTCDGSFNYNPYNLLQVPQQLWTATALARYDITDSVEAFTRLSFANNQVRTVLAPTVIGDSFQYGYLDNPLLSQSLRDRWALVDAEDDSPGDGIVDVDMLRRMTELGTRDSHFENTSYQFVGGLSGRLWEDHRWEVFGQYGHTSRNQTFSNDVNLARVRLAADVVDDGLGNPVCRINADADPGNDDPACVAANFFGAGNLDPAAIPYLRLGSLLEVDRTRQQVFGASLSGNLPWQLPLAANRLGYALGLEYREEKGEARPDGIYESGLAGGFGASSPVDARIKIQEVFGEMLLPVASDLRFAREINIETGIRYARYRNQTDIDTESFSNNAYNTSWKLGADWKPSDELRLSAMFQRAVRAPTLQEIGLPRTSSIGDLMDDPCDNDGPPADPALVALCEATGVPPGQVGNFMGSIAGQINNFVGGNPQLRPEKADTWTVGLQWAPAAIEGLEIKLDYYNIDIDHAIVAISEQNIVNGCYHVERDANGFFCSRIHRNATTGSLFGNTSYGIDKSLVNAARETAKGLDLALRYGFDLGHRGFIDLGLNANYVFERTTKDAAITSVKDCAGLAGVTCLRPLPELSFVQTTRWTWNALTLQLSWRYTDHIRQDAIELEGADPAGYAVPRIASQSYFDLAGSYGIDETWTLRAGIVNLFDRDPPVIGGYWGGTTENSGNTFPATYDPLGRVYSVGISARF